MAKLRIKESLKKIPGLRPLVSGVKRAMSDLAAFPDFLAERRISRQGPIRVGFLCQYIPSWHKHQPIYELMKKDPRFEPVLICVPSNIKDSRLIGSDYSTNDTYTYFLDNGFPEAYNALQPDGSWLDLASLNLSYVFYPRPYNSFMPEPYHGNVVRRFSKICIILYGAAMAKETNSATLNRDFFRSVYCYFAELPQSRRTNELNGWLAHKLGLQQSVYYGMPGVEAILEAKETTSSSWVFSKNSFRALWTPRWTTDPALGGSNFFRYYQCLFDYAKKNPDTDLLFRPHPLALSHFQETGEMTAEEAQTFLEQCQQIPNVELDIHKEYTATLWGTDVFVTDITGMILEMFVTGKPLIYCSSDSDLTLEENSSKIVECSYIVHNAQELTACLAQLKRGEDPLAQKWAQVHAELFPDRLCHPALRITEHLASK